MKNISDFGWLMIAFSITMVAIAWGASNNHTYSGQLGEKECETYAMASRSNVPVGCYEYFRIK